MPLTRTQALEHLRSQIGQTPVRGGSVSSPEFKKWYRDTSVVIKEVFEGKRQHVLDFQTIDYSWPRDDNDAAYAAGLEKAKAILTSMFEEVEKFWPDSLSTNSQAKAVEVLLQLLDHFPRFAKTLKGRRIGRDPVLIEDEYDVQYLLHALLCLHFEDVRPEETTPSQAGAASRMDFLLKSESIVVEVKMTRDGLRDGKLGGELLIDINRYQSHPACRTLACFVYDPEMLLSNPRGLENDLTKKTW